MEAEQFADIVIKKGADGQVTLLKDVARIELGAKDYNSGLFLDGEPTVGLAIFQLPVSLIGTFAVMAAMDLVLAIGIVVDDAIVVVENVERHIAMGLTARDATRLAMDEVGTGRRVRAYRFHHRRLGRFLQTIHADDRHFDSHIDIQFADPEPCLVRIAAGRNKDKLTRLIDRLFGWFFKGFNRFFDLFSEGYACLVGRLIRMTAVVLVLYLGLTGLNFLAFEKVPTGFIPQQDQGYLILYAELIAQRNQQPGLAGLFATFRPGYRDHEQADGIGTAAGIRLRMDRA